MSGTKGRSGRRPKNYNNAMVQDVLKQSMYVIHKYLNDPTISLQKKADIASKFAVKAIPERVLFDEVKKLSFEERMRLISEFQKVMESREERVQKLIAKPKAEKFVEVMTADPDVIVPTVVEEPKPEPAGLPDLPADYVAPDLPTLEDEVGAS